MVDIIQFPSPETSSLIEDGPEVFRIAPEDVLNSALNEDFNDVLVIGRRSNGLFFIASSTADIGKLLIFLEGTKAVLVDQIDTDTVD